MRKLNRFIIYLIILGLPLYLVRFKVWKIPVNLMELMVCLCLILFIFIVLFFGGIRKIDFLEKEKWLQYSIFLIFAGLIISVIFSENLKVSAGIFKGWFIIPLIFLILLINNIKTEQEINSIIICLFISGTIVCLISLYFFINKNLTYDGRLKAFYLSPNYLAMYLSPIFFLSLHLYFVLKNNISRILLAVADFLFLFVIYLTYSYGAVLAVLGGLLVLAILKKGLFRAFGVLILIILIIGIFSFPGILVQKMPSLKSRLAIWRSALEIIKDHPIVGIGPGMFQEYYLNYQSKFPPYPEWAVPQPHNIFLAFYLQAGIIGLIGFIWLLAVFFRNCFVILSVSEESRGKNNKSAGSFTSPSAKFRMTMLLGVLAMAMLCILFHGLIDTTYWKNDLAMVFWIIIALCYIANHLSYS